MNYEEMKAKHPNWNWSEAEELEQTDPSALQDGADHYDRLKEKLYSDFKDYQELCDKLNIHESQRRALFGVDSFYKHIELINKL